MHSNVDEGATRESRRSSVESTRKWSACGGRKGRKLHQCASSEPWKPTASSVGAKQRTRSTYEPSSFGREQLGCHVESRARESAGEASEELEDARVSHLSRSVPIAPRPGSARPGGTADRHGWRVLHEHQGTVVERRKPEKKGRKSHHYDWIETHSKNQSTKAEEEKNLLQSLRRDEAIRRRCKLLQYPRRLECLGMRHRDLEPRTKPGMTRKKKAQHDQS